MVSKTSLQSGVGGKSTSGSLVQNQSSISNIIGTQNTTTNANASSTESKVSDYLDPTSRKALEDLIRQLSGSGGIARGPGSEKYGQANKYGEQRLKEISTNQANRADYSKANAFADAQAAMASQLAKALEQAMPTLTAGIDAAGTSGSAMQALLTQQAAENAARNAAELGLNAAISYGQLQTGFGDILERLTSEGDPVTNQLLQALGIAKGAYENTTAKSNSSSSQNSNTTTNQTSTENTTTTQKTKEDAGVGSAKTGFQFQKFPDMSTPGYSASYKKQQSSGNSNSSSSYKGAYGF